MTTDNFEFKVPGNFLVTRAIELINNYTFQEPLHHYLKREFRLRKQMGARDRRWMREIIYSWFRLGKALAEINQSERLLLAFYLVKKENDDLAKSMLKEHPVFHPENVADNLNEKLKIIVSNYPSFSLNDIFPFKELMSPLLEKDEFIECFLNQPKVWLRVKDASKNQVLKEFDSLKISYEVINDFPKAIAVEQGVKLNDTVSFKKGLFEIQDLSSQRTANYFLPNKGERWYDCCAASGGKSLLLMDLAENIQLAVSDSREIILENLKERFKKSGIRSYHNFVTDLELSPPVNLHSESLDGIIADVPCSGSGTWARTPEQLQTFSLEILEKYVLKQRKILSNISHLLKPGKPLIYITCSVFKAENEDAINYAIEELGFKFESKQLVQGMSLAADTLFVARLIR